MVQFPVFFGVDGITSTSANHIANLAKEYIRGIERELNKMQFYKSAVTLIGSTEYNVVENGNNDEFVAKIPVMLEEIVKAKLKNLLVK